MRRVRIEAPLPLPRTRQVLIRSRVGSPTTRKALGNAAEGLLHSSSCRDHSLEYRPHSCERSRPVAELVFDEGRKLSERSVVFGYQEQRVVSKPARTANLAENSPSASRFSLGANRPGRVGESERADEPRASISVGSSFQRGEQLSIIGRVVAVRPRISRRVNARRSMQCVDGESGIVGQCPAAERNGRGARFDSRVPREGWGVFHGIREIGMYVKRLDFETTENRVGFPRREEETDHLLPLLSISGRKHQPRSCRRGLGSHGRLWSLSSRGALREALRTRKAQ
jgi:hypothetical protein